MKSLKHKISIHARGFTLVELMVAITVGLFLTAAIASLYVSNAISFKTQDESSRLQESVRGAFDTLGYHIRQAGFVEVATDTLYVQLLTNPQNKAFYRKTTADPDDQLARFFGQTTTQYHTGADNIHGIHGCNGEYDSTSFATFPWDCSATAGSSSMTLSYQAQPSSRTDPGTVRTVKPDIDTLGAYNATTGAGGDCGGQDVNGTAAVPKGPLAINRFYVDITNKRLMCLGNGAPGTPKPIAEGVEKMLILYGVMPTTHSATVQNDLFVGRYVTADNVTLWSEVLSIRVCLQFVSLKKVTPSSILYKDCSGADVTATDGKIRQISRATFSLRNNLITIPDAV